MEALTHSHYMGRLLITGVGIHHVYADGTSQILINSLLNYDPAPVLVVMVCKNPLV